ncbi:photosystem II protein PsbQ [Synechococcus sp. M16CYN]|uniref:photosystem II protein PsbQ n=1 Tax=Synechococcus sp. M16CYN TaxID=3103139 RepID=UPI00324D23A2
MLKAMRRLAAFCLCISLSWGLIAPVSSGAATTKPKDLTVIKRQAEAFVETKARLPELARLVSAEDWTFTRNLIHGPMQEVGREMLYINASLDRAERKEADKLARSLKDALADLDEAARLQDADQMQKAYSTLAASFDAYSGVIPAEALS